MPLRLNTPMPELTGATEWLNGSAPAAEELAGQPVLVYFWSVSCHICHENMPKVMEWRDTYAPRGLRMIAIHAPRQEADLDVEQVRAKISEYGITEACGVDNNLALLNTFQNTFLPAYYLYDKQGILRRRSAGEAGVTMLAPALEQVMAE